MEKEPLKVKLVKKKVKGKVVWVIVLSSMVLMICVFIKSSAVAQKIRCSVFKNQEQAQKAFEQGSKNLDRDHNGVACQNNPHE